MTSTASDQDAKLTPTSRFTVEPEPGEHAWHSQLLLDGASTGRRVPGLRVEAQFGFGDRWLLLLDNDNGFDGYLYILLLEPSLELIDQRELGCGWGNPSFVMHLRVAAANAIEFGFFSDGDCWRLTILPSPRFMWIDWDRRETRQWSKLFSRRWMALDEVIAGRARGADGPE